MWFHQHSALRFVVALSALSLANASVASAAASDLCFRGVNLSGAEYGDANGIEGQNFIYPTTKTSSYFAGKGFDTVRLPFRWERLQPRLGESFDANELGRLKQAVARLRAQGFSVILDPHNFGYFGSERIGSAEVPVRAFAHFWTRLAVEFANEDRVAFGLMYEPNDIAPNDWLRAANAAIAGIRAAKARNLILVPGTRWSGVRSWQADMEGGSNADVMLGVKDPLNRYAFEVHTYFDVDSSGTHAECVAADDVAKAFESLTHWLRKENRRAFLGEFGGSYRPECLAAIAKTVTMLGDNSDVWLGWTYWAGGDWWPPDEHMNIQPGEKGDKPQLLALKAAMGPPSDSAGACSAALP